MAETDCTQFSIGQQLEIGRRFDSTGELARMLEVRLNCAPERPETVISHGQPDLQPAKPSRELQGFFEKGESLDRIFVQRPGVIATVRERLPCETRFAVEQAPAIVGLVQPLVRVQRNRISQAQAEEARRDGDCSERTVSAVYVEPQVVLAGNLGDLHKWVNRPGIHGSRRGNGGDRLSSLTYIEFNGVLQRGGIESVSFVRG